MPIKAEVGRTPWCHRRYHATAPIRKLSPSSPLFVPKNGRTPSIDNSTLNPCAHPRRSGPAGSGGYSTVNGSKTPLMVSDEYAPGQPSTA